MGRGLCSTLKITEGSTRVVGVGEVERTQKHNMGGVHYKEEEKAVSMNMSPICQTWCSRENILASMKDGPHFPLLVT